MSDIKHTKTPRGFVRYEFTDGYGSKCSLQESSNIDPYVWFGVDIDFEGRECTRMHLTPEIAKELLPVLQHFADSTYLPQPDENK